MCLGSWFDMGFVTMQNIKDIIAANPVAESDDQDPIGGIEWDE
jgi:hypothetical protein